MHLVAHRAHRAIGAFGLQQVLDQPARGVQPGVRALLDQIGPGTGHAVQAQLLEFDRHVTHGRPPRCVVDAVGAQAVVARRVRPAAAPTPAASSRPLSGAGAAFSRASTLTTCSTLTLPGWPGLQRQLHRHQHRVQPGRRARWPAPAPSRGRRPGRAAALGAAAAAARACRRTARRCATRRASVAAAGCSAASHTGSAPALLRRSWPATTLSLGHHDHAARVQPRADHLPDQLARHRVAVARHRHQAGAGHPRGLLDVAVERRRASASGAASRARASRPR